MFQYRTFLKSNRVHKHGYLYTLNHISAKVNDVVLDMSQNSLIID